MTTMVEQVVRALDKSKLSPAKTTGEYDKWKREEERARKDLKRSKPNHKPKWDGQSWKIRQRQNQDIENNRQPISEFSFRTIGIAASLAKVKEYSSKANSGIQKLKTLGSSLQSATDEKDRLQLSR